MNASRRFVIIAAAGISFLPLLARAEEAKWPGVITSASGSAIISTEGMSPGGEVWAGWMSLPAGAAVQFSGAGYAHLFCLPL